MGSPRPLDGIVIVEFGHSVAAPYAGLILADLGARVVKIEEPESGDYSRGWGPPFWRDVASAYQSLNRGKESLAVDFTDAAQCERLRTFILDEADAVIQNLRAGVLSKFGLDCETLRARKPELLWADIGAFGASGPLARKPGYDPLTQAFSGIMSITGEADRPPVRVGVSLIDMGAGMWTVIGLLAALIARAKSGSGTQVATSLYETGLAWMTVPLAGYAANGEVRKPHGSGIAEIVPYQAFRTATGWLMIAAGNDRLFRKLVEVVGLPELANDPDYATNTGRVIRREKLIAMLDDKIKSRTIDDLSAALDHAGVPNAPLQTVDQVMHHPQTAAVGMLDAPAPDDLPTAGVAITFDGSRPRAAGAAPGLGAHNAILSAQAGSKT